MHLHVSSGGYAAGELPREKGARVLPGAEAIEIALPVGEGATAIQPGFSVAGGDVTWLDRTGGPAQENYRIGVGADQVETEGDKPLWAFFARLTLPPGVPADDACPSGAGRGTWETGTDVVKAG